VASFVNLLWCRLLLLMLLYISLSENLHCISSCCDQSINILEKIDKCSNTDNVAYLVTAIYINRKK